MANRMIIASINLIKGLQMKRLLTLAGLALASLIGAFAFTAPAHATPTCTKFTDSSATYPADTAGHEQICFSATSQDELGIATAVRQLPRGTNQAYSVVSGSGATIYYFQNRADAVSYMQNTAPYSNHTIYASQAQSGHCGFTASLSDGTLIATGIYQTCSYDGITPATGTNPDLNHTVKHEMGHVYDFAEIGIQGHTPSGTVGYSTSSSPPNYLQDGLNKLTPSNWSSLTSTQKNSVVCGIWSNIVISPLERSLIVSSGGTDPGAGTSVCVTSGPTLVIASQFVGLTPTQIAQKIEPYFVTASKPQEPWAESFAVVVGVQTPPSPGFLQLSDRIFINNNYTCAVMDVTQYINTGLPPSQTEINGHGCSFTPGQL